MPEELSTYDPASALTSDEAIEVFINDALETGDANHIAAALGVVARARGMPKMAPEANPTLKTLLSVMKELGMSLSATARSGG